MRVSGFSAAHAVEFSVAVHSSFAATGDERKYLVSGAPAVTFPRPCINTQA